MTPHNILTKIVGPSLISCFIHRKVEKSQDHVGPQITRVGIQVFTGQKSKVIYTLVRYKLKGNDVIK